jgi:FkbM family methyltransferase
MKQYFDKLKTVKGIIQIGANLGQEISVFSNFTNNIILIEPIPNLATNLKNSFPHYMVLPYALGSTNSEMDFYIASNNGASSSLLKPLNHPIFYPDIQFSSPIKISVRTFESLIDELKIDMSLFNIIISDVQGYDLEAIKGFGNYICNFDLIIAEYINSSLYENDGNLHNINVYLSSFGFELVETYDENLGAGNAVFLKK